MVGMVRGPSLTDVGRVDTSGKRTKAGQGLFQDRPRAVGPTGPATVSFGAFSVDHLI